MSARFLFAFGAACVLAFSPTAHSLAGAEGPVEKFRQLVEQRNSLQRHNALLKREADRSATRDPYILFDPVEMTFSFRVRGRTMKTYKFSSISLDDRMSRPASAEVIFRAIDGALTVKEKQGGHPELIPPDPETGREAGLLYSDPNQLASQTGAAPVRTDAGMLGVDVPTEYYVSFDEDVVFHIRNPRTLTFRQKAAYRLGEIASSIRASSLFGWVGSQARELPRQPRLSLWLTADVETAKHLHYSLLPGEAVFVVPPPPPKVVLAARK